MKARLYPEVDKNNVSVVLLSKTQVVRTHRVAVLVVKQHGEVKVTKVSCEAESWKTRFTRSAESGKLIESDDVVVCEMEESYRY